VSCKICSLVGPDKRRPHQGKKVRVSSSRLSEMLGQNNSNTFLAKVKAMKKSENSMKRPTTASIPDKRNGGSGARNHGRSLLPGLGHLEGMGTEADPKGRYRKSDVPEPLWSRSRPTYGLVCPNSREHTNQGHLSSICVYRRARSRLHTGLWYRRRYAASTSATKTLTMRSVTQVSQQLPGVERRKADQTDAALRFCPRVKSLGFPKKGAQTT